ncbi:mechanosensitive ion channel family protein [Gryllotalpicola ginsengisoli]|uniref:mechanosensitive ion channel family protein n=1 Tax=Gryllotalpicola ginsengisoli TaxID=444608 RepID=UPI0003B45D9B|nr:mechanosensitive ion channel domain-containing protein [Gryllotalpicola ginsengisoli]
MSDLPSHHNWIAFGIAVAAAIVFGIVVTAVGAFVSRLAVRTHAHFTTLPARLRRPFRVLLLVVFDWIAVHVTLPAPAAVRHAVDHGFLILTIVAAAWFASRMLLFFEDIGVSRYRLDVPDNRVARRVHTQMTILRRLTVVAIVIVAVAAILLSYPEVRVVGASVLASAGVVSVIAGLAAQSTLGNLFAGLQLAFNGAIRVDDVVVVQGEWGRIEEITLTYIVVHIWDDRRLVLPSTYFTTQPFENWTRHSAELLGSVDFDLDWRVEPARMREQLDLILAHTDLWDGRVKVLQVTDAVGGFVHVRILLTARDSPTLFDLRCHVRESMIAWIQRESDISLPRQRVIVGEAPKRAAARTAAAPPQAPAEGLFTGSFEAIRRADHFTQGEALAEAADAQADEGPTEES